MQRRSRYQSNARHSVAAWGFLTAAGLASAVFVVSMFIAAASSFASQNLVLPKLDEKGFDRMPQRTKIFAADGKLLTIFYHENREQIGIDQIPDNLIRATIAIEDQRFYEHGGVDPRSIFRAMLSNFKQGRVVQGGSTITQQLVKNVFLNNERTFDRKFREAVLAYQLEGKYSKKKIMELYLNTVYYGNGAYGTKTAAELFFGKKPKELTVDEAALLAGLPKAPSRFSPYIDPAGARSRRNVVLKRMLKMKFINRTQYELALAKDLTLRAPQTKSSNAAHFVEYVRQTLKEKYGNKRLYGGGLNVYTTIDLRMQEAAEKAISGTLNRPGDPSAALVTVDPRTGFIKAAVGGRDFESDQFNLAIQGRRQAGSSFKTFVLVTALARGISPDTVFSGASPISIRLGMGQNWSVKNFGGSSMGSMPLREATVKSVNTVFAQLIMRVGAGNVSRMAHKMGITSPVDALPSIALGGLSRGISPLDMASAYGTLANQGSHVAATPISKITKMNGEVVFEAKPQPSPAVDKNVASAATQILQEVVQRGTGKRAQIGRPVAGKTGTSENLTDAWFVGYTPQLSTAVWVGYPKAKIPMDSVHGISVVGGSFPAEIWQKFMSEAMKGMEVMGFAGPEKSGPVEICPDMKNLATGACPEKKVVDAKEAKNITEPCQTHKPKAPAPARPTPVNPQPAPPQPAAPAPEPAPAPAPEPAPEPVPEPEPAPKPEPKPAPAPAPKPEPAPAPAPEPQPEAPPAPDTQPPPG